MIDVIQNCLIYKGYDCFRNDGILYVIKDGVTLQYEEVIINQRLNDCEMPFSNEDLVATIDTFHNIKRNIL